MSKCTLDGYVYYMSVHACACVHACVRACACVCVCAKGPTTLCRILGPHSCTSQALHSGQLRFLSYRTIGLSAPHGRSTCDARSLSPLRFRLTQGYRWDAPPIPSTVDGEALRRCPLDSVASYRCPFKKRTVRYIDGPSHFKGTALKLIRFTLARRGLAHP